MKNRDNAFDFLRLFAAFLVFFSHHFALSRLPQPLFLNWDTYGFVAVAMFFAISGYFMPGSFSNSANLIVYLTKRCLRIFPGLIVCSFLICYGIGTAFTKEPVLSYLCDPETFKTMVSYIAFLGKPIPGVFDDFLLKGDINGSLWTLSVEFLSYIILGIALCYSNSWKSVFPLFLASSVITLLIKAGFIPNISFYTVPLNYLALFLIAFTTGSLLSQTQRQWFPVRIPMAGLSLFCLFALKGHVEIFVLGTASLAVLTILVGVSFKDRVIQGKYDISYGFYIYAFPIQQMVINRITQAFWPSFVIALFLTVVAGFLSYKYVESPFLYAHKNRKRTQAPEQSPSFIGENPA